jgi:hypothetical protein
MDRTKTKTFIAFINSSGKDKYWIDGNCTFEQDRPTILPYETEEQIESAKNYARTMGIWDEVTDVWGVILKVSGSPFEIINRREADIIAKEYKDKEIQRKLDAGVFKPQDKKKRGKKEVAPAPAPVTPPPTVVKKEIVVKTKKDDSNSEKPKRAKFTIEE